MEGADDVEHSLLELVGIDLGRHAGVGVVEHALVAGAGGADIAAGVAADALAQLALPEGEALLGGHRFQLGHLAEAVAAELHAGFLVVDHFVGHSKGLALAVLTLAQHQLDALFLLALRFSRLDLFMIQHALAAHADHIDLFAVHAVLGHELIHAQRVAGLEEDQGLALFFAGLDEVFAQVRAGIVAINQVFQLVGGLEEGGRQVVVKVALHPAQNTLNGSVSEQSRRSGSHHFSDSLHLRSPSFTFSPSSVMVLTKSFIVAANFGPSAADTHSTRVRPLSMPM